MSTVRLRPEVAVVAVLLAVLSLPWSLEWLAAVIVHEVGHGLLGAALVRRRWGLDVQLGAADAYLQLDDDARTRWTVALSGLVASLLFAAGLVAADLEASAAWAWLGYQAFIFPASDGGVLLRDGLVRRGWGASRAFRRTYAVSVLAAVGLLGALWVLGWMEPFGIGLGLLVGAVVMAETEWPALIHVEAYRAWNEGRFAEVLTWAEQLRRGGPRLWSNVRDLAARAAVELGRRDDVVTYGRQLPAEHPARLDAAEWLLRRDDTAGADWAESALDDFLRVPSRWDRDRRERLRELLVSFALFESRRGRAESAAGLLERAGGLGPLSYEWLEYEPGGPELLRHPRVARLRTD